MPRLRAIALCAAMTFCGLGPTAHAEPSASEQARSHLSIGASLYRATRYAEALREFEAAFELSRKPLVLVNIGQCQRKLGHPREALDAYERYLSLTALDDPQRADVEKLAALSKEELAQAPAPVEVPPPIAVEPAPIPALVLHESPPAPRSRRPLWIGLGVGGAIVVAGAVTLALVFTLPASAPSSRLGTYPLFR